MKRLAWLLLMAVLSFSTVGYSIPASPPAPVSISQPSPAAGRIPGYNIICDDVRGIHLCASVSEALVVPGSWVTIYGLMMTKGAPIQGMIMRVAWHSSTSVTCIGVTDETGLASCTTYVPAKMARGYKVYVKVYLDHYKMGTSFRTRDMTHEEQSDD